jgi:hypothetical protein
VFIFYGQKTKSKTPSIRRRKVYPKSRKQVFWLRFIAIFCAFPGFTQWQNAETLTLTAAGPHGLLTHFPFLGVFSPTLAIFNI